MNLRAAFGLRWRKASLTLLPLLTAGETLAAPLPGGFAHSGWYQFELIVLADTRRETLESETWPMMPTVGYPARWRWLQNPDMVARLTEAHPEAEILASPSGHLRVQLPARPAPLWTATEGLLTEGDLSVIDELIELGEGADTSAYSLSLETLSPATESEMELKEKDSSGPILPFEKITPAQSTTSLTGLESLGIAGPKIGPTSSAVAIPYAAPIVVPELLPVTVSARAIPMPEPFIQQPLEQLAAGLARYRRSNEDELIASASWLQGPWSDSLAILLEPDTDSDYPRVQGFIQLLPRGGAWRLGINFWANTHGHYLPDFFEMPPPPSSPQRVAIIEAIPDLPQSPYSDTLPQVTLEDTWSQSDSASLATTDTMPWFPQTKSREDGISDSASRATSVTQVAVQAPIPQAPEWPWRHMIHVADTIPLTENRLRYYDHPVIKVIALWRELSWYEVFAQGQRKLSAAESSAP